MRVFLIAGEPSGDLLGGRLMASLKRLHPHVRFSGVGGKTMQAEGLTSLFPMEELSVMGLAEVLPKLPELFKRRDETAYAIMREQPDVVITIDAPDFSFRVAKKVKELGYVSPLVHYVAPTVWAWRAGRAKKLADLYDHVLCLFPFEPPYFEREGMKASFIGHSATESGAGKGEGAAFRTKHNIPSNMPVLCLLPGSRRSEMKHMLPLFQEVLAHLPKKIQLVMPTLPRWEDLVRTTFPSAIMTTVEQEKWDAFAASDVALAASGTVTLELALSGVPTITTNRMGLVSTALFKCMLKNKYFALPNLILDQEVMPEFFFGKCRADLIAPAVAHLLKTPKARNAQKKALAEVAKRMKPNADKTPSDIAAKVVLDLARR